MGGQDPRMRRPLSRAMTVDDADTVHSGRSHRSHRPRRSPRDDESVQYGLPFEQAFPDIPRRHSAANVLRPGPPPRIRTMPSGAERSPLNQPLWSPTSPLSPEQSCPQFAMPQYTQLYPDQAPSSPQFPQPNYYQPSPVLQSPNAQLIARPKPGLLNSRPSTPLSRAEREADLALAYGTIPPDLLYPGSPSIVSSPVAEEAELKGLVGHANRLLDEAQCVKHSVTATIAMLQKNPDAMAAVGLTLAEISSLAKKLSPTVLMSMKTWAPAVFALLSSPQFLIAVGVAAGVTIVAFGGYKIVKRIQARGEMDNQGAEELLLPVEDMGKINSWRRGIAEVAEESDGISVEGEFITPMARNLSRMNLAEDQRERPHTHSRRRGPDDDAQSRASGRGSRSGALGSESGRSTKSRSRSEPPRESRDKAKRSGGTGKFARERPVAPSERRERVKEKVKEKKPSRLRMMLLA